MKIPDEQAENIAQLLTEETNDAKRKLEAAMKGEKDKVPHVVVNKYKHTVDLFMSNDRNQLLKLNNEHYNKL